MVVGGGQFVLYFPGVHSLKEKRRILKSIIDRARNSFNISISEIDSTEQWQKAVLGITLVAGRKTQVEKIMDSICRWMDNHVKGEILDCQLFLEIF